VSGERDEWQVDRDVIAAATPGNWSRSTSCTKHPSDGVITDDPDELARQDRYRNVVLQPETSIAFDYGGAVIAESMTERDITTVGDRLADHLDQHSKRGW
jgi:hypothetical protein